MLDQETGHARELVGLRWDNNNVEFHAGEVLTTHLEAVRSVRVVENIPGSRLGNALLKSLYRFVVFLALAGGIVISNHF